MATRGANVVTYMDLASRMGPDNKISGIIELMNDTNEILEDMAIVEGNLPTGHKSTIRTGLPTVAWRLLNYGVQPSKSITSQVTDTCGMLEGYGQVDKSLAELNGNTAAWRLSENRGYLEAMNQPPVLMARRRPNLIPEIVQRVEPPEWIVQNITQALLLQEATADLKPKTILDLCAAPGGKLIALADRFPQAQLFANDLRLKRLRENLETYQVKAQVCEGRGEEYPTDRLFDLVVVDASCSNSGVLGKRPEARWRLDDEHLSQLTQLQEALITHAAELVAPGGTLLYMTCSILPEENHPRLDWPKTYERTILPHAEYDGGYACAIFSDS